MSRHGALVKKVSLKISQIYRKTSVPRCLFNKAGTP